MYLTFDELDAQLNAPIVAGSYPLHPEVEAEHIERGLESESECAAEAQMNHVCSGFIGNAVFARDGQLHADHRAVQAWFRRRRISAEGCQLCGTEDTGRFTQGQSALCDDCTPEAYSDDIPF